MYTKILLLAILTFALTYEHVYDYQSGQQVESFEEDEVLNVPFIEAEVLAVPSKTCRLSQAEKAEALAAHNKARCEVSPKAKSMPKMVWDEELAKQAQAHADKCIWEHASRAERDGKGENLYASAGSQVSMTRAIVSWDNEKKDYDFNGNTGHGEVVGHYTQIVWAASTRVGCAKQRCGLLKGTGWKQADIVVCRYNPAGNFVGRRPYEASNSGTNDACGGATKPAPRPTPRPTPTPRSTPRPTPTPATSCTNGRGDKACNYWKGKGYCKHTYTGFMKANCEKACGCQPPKDYGRVLEVKNGVTLYQNAAGDCTIKRGTQYKYVKMRCNGKGGAGRYLCPAAKEKTMFHGCPKGGCKLCSVEDKGWGQWC